MALTPSIQIGPPIYRQFKSHNNFLVKFHRHNTAPTVTTDNVQAVVSKDDDYLPWLEKKAGTKITSVLSIGNSAYGRALFATEKIKAGDTILRVPFKVKISLKNLFSEIDTSIGDEVQVASKLAVFILSEQRQGRNSEWAPFITRLPKPGELHTTVLWSEDELDMIRHSSVYQETIDLRAQMKRDFSVIKPVLDRFPEMFEDVTFEDFSHACCLVHSRGWGDDFEMAMIPFADFFNHDGDSKSSMVHDGNARYSEVIADRDYNPGEEVFIRYAKFPNSSLLLGFGFTVPFNKYDQVRIQVDIPCHDHLRAIKLDLLRQHGLSKSNNAIVTSSGGSFVIKKLVFGKAKPFLEPLRAFTRVMCCSSLQELNVLVMKARPSDGCLARKPLVNRSMELLAHQTLLLLINELIEKHHASIKCLGVSDTTKNCNRLTTRRPMALDLLIGELDILRSVSVWLGKYCHSIKSSASSPSSAEFRNPITN